MNKILLFVWKKLLQLTGFIPRKLPIGVEEFDLFCSQIFKLYDLPNTRSYKQCIATMIMHQSPTTHKVPPRFFGVSIKKAQANEIAYSMIQKFKKEIAEEEKPPEVVTG